MLRLQNIQRNSNSFFSLRGTHRNIRLFSKKAVTSVDDQKLDDTDSHGHPRIPFRGWYELEKCDVRRQWVERFTGTKLEQVGEWWKREGSDDSTSTLKLKGNIENVIGLVKIPVGVAGPLLFNGEDVHGYQLCPFATTEGALIASATRGSTAITRAGGVWTATGTQEISRNPLFKTRSIKETQLLWKWLKENQSALSDQVNMYSQHANLVDLRAIPNGCCLGVEFVYSTGDASGQNMTTSTTWHTCKWILSRVSQELPQVKVEYLMVEDSSSSDKKLSFRNLIRTRGTFAQAEAWLPESIIRDVLKIDVKTLLEGYSILMSGEVQSGTIGNAINSPNALAAIFAATGQDIAAIVESSAAILQLFPYRPKTGHYKSGASSSHLSQQCDHLPNFDLMDKEGGIYVSLKYPSLCIGTVGGGTGIVTQKECLQMMGCFGKGKRKRLGEMIAGFSLALELSLMAALSSGQFAQAHEKLGRNRPDNGLKERHLNESLFSQVLGHRGKLLSWKPMKVNTGSSILSELTKSEMSKKVGHFGYDLWYRDTNGDERELPVVIKAKALDSETYNIVNKMAQGCGLQVAGLFENFKSEVGFKHCHEREIQIALNNDPNLRKYTPEVYHVIRNPPKDIYVMITEFLSKDKFDLLNSADDISGWTTGDIETVLTGIAEIHSLNFNKGAELSALPWMDSFTAQRMVRLEPLWQAMLQHAVRDFPEMWTEQRQQIVNKALNQTTNIWSVLDDFPKTLIHGDCNPRNSCLRKLDTEEEGRHRLCLYDWELCTVHVPQRDLVEFLSFVLPPEATFEDWIGFIKFYAAKLEEYTGQQFQMSKFLEVYDMASLDFAMTRLLLYTIAHTFKDYKFLPRVVDSIFSYIQQRREQPIDLLILK